MKKIELLAPAASFEGMKAVINAGADAVYIGGDKFGARAYADNLDKDSLIEAIQYAHLHNVKVHLTVNTIFKQHEIENELYDYILPYYEAGIDAVIVQDMGVLDYIHIHFPNLEMHMSTQTTITSSECLSIINRYGINRIVLARELSIPEIEEIKRSTGVEVETFVHGALCYSYSGQCLMSSMIGDRSGNRGRCAQPCRKKYRLFIDNEEIGNERYLLSPKDMCGLANIQELITIGVDSLKIEGRMKKPEYAAIIVSVYRKYIDLFYRLGYSEYIKYIKNNSVEFQNDILKMQDVYNRGGFTKGYFNQHNGSDMMSVYLPSHQGVMVGKVVEVNNRSCSIKLSKDINRQDVLLIRDKVKVDEKSSYEFTVKDNHSNGEIIKTNYLKGIHLNKGQLVYRIKNNELLDFINKKYIEDNKRVYLSLDIILLKNKCAIVKAKIYDKVFEYKFDKVTEANNRPISGENVIKQFSKLNNTPFVIDNINVEMDNDVFVPIKVLNDMRRYVIEHIIIDYNKVYTLNRSGNIDDNKNVATAYNNTDKVNSDIDVISDKEEYSRSVEKTSQTLGVLVSNKKNLNVVIKYEDVDDIYLELDAFKLNELKECILMLAKTKYNIILALPRIIRSNGLELLENDYASVLNMKEINGYLVRNIEGISLAKKYGNDSTKIITDNNLYVANDYAKKAWQEQGADIVGISLELSKEELEQLDTTNCQVLLYGKPVVMVTAGCVKKTNDMCNHRDENMYIKDSYGECYPVRNVCNYCYNLIYNSKAINVIYDALNENICGNYRIDFIDEKENEVKDILDSYLNKTNKKDVFKGHYSRKIL